MGLRAPDSDSIEVFPSELGWLAIFGQGAVLKRLSFGHESPDAAIRALPAAAAAPVRSWNRALVERLKAFAAGAADDFRDVRLDLGPQTEFQRRVVAACRRVGYGRTTSYLALAEAAGYPGAARAVGSVMRTNRVPLVVPCHRVLAAGGGLGGYSAPQGLSMKRRLLDLESARTRTPARPRAGSAAGSLAAKRRPRSVAGQA